MTLGITIIGGGITGLSIGWHLAKAGQAVTILEKNKLPDGSTAVASGAAAGMISPAGEVIFQEEHLLPLYTSACEQWPAFVEQLRLKDEDIDFFRNGTLFTAINEDDGRDLLRLHEHQKSLGLKVDLLDAQQSSELEPNLAKHVMAVWSRDEYSVDVLRLLNNLKKQFEESGGEYLSGREVTHIHTNDSAVTSLSIKNTHTGSIEKYPATQVVMATGIDSVETDLQLKFFLRAVKGQALELQMTENLRINRTVRSLHHYPVYMVPRKNGRLTVGATSEETGNTDTTAGSLLDLLYGAWKIFPATYEMKFLGTWTGLRPATKDNAPIVGETEVSGLFLTLGLYRHGYLMAPLIGRTMADLILKKEKPNWLSKYSYKRFL